MSACSQPARPVTIVASYGRGPLFEKNLLALADSQLVERIMIVSPEQIHLNMPRCSVLPGETLRSGKTLNLVLADIKTDFLLLMPENRQLLVGPNALERILTTARSKKSGLVYTDFYDESKRGSEVHPLNDYQPGSVRDVFDFGAILFFSMDALRGTMDTYGPIPDVQYAGLYDLRLKLSIRHSLCHLREPLYSVVVEDESAGSKEMFAYVDPRNIGVQREMEDVFTDYLKKIGAYLTPHGLKYAGQPAGPFPVEASVIIPVRNRKKTIADAVKSAFMQDTGFPFNVIVVDNRSSDGTTAALFDLSRQFAALKHIIPARTDLGIGGCWNEAVQSNACGRYSVQLDSDDLYGSSHSLQKIVDVLRHGRLAMAIGSYTLVDFNLREIHPGLIDHREWTSENGHNNALRVNGLGAPRAFDTDLIRKTGFLNVSYGEDYAAALRICREYRVGRIFESLYLCRRWQGNTDACPSVQEANQNDAFKDRIRTDEILARKKINEGELS